MNITRASFVCRTYNIHIKILNTKHILTTCVTPNVCSFLCRPSPLHSRLFYSSFCPISCRFNHSKQNLISMYEFYYCRFSFFHFYFLAWMCDILFPIRTRSISRLAPVCVHWMARKKKNWWRKGTECHMHLSRKFSRWKWWDGSRMEIGKFYYMRLSVCLNVCECECVSVFKLFSVRFRYVCDCRYRLKCIQNYYLYFRKYCVDVHIPIVIRFISRIFECLNGWCIVTAAAAAIDEQILLIQQLISPIVYCTYSMSARLKGRDECARKIWTAKEIEWDTCIFTCD